MTINVSCLTDLSQVLCNKVIICQSKPPHIPYKGQMQAPPPEGAQKVCRRITISGSRSHAAAFFIAPPVNRKDFGSTYGVSADKTIEYRFIKRCPTKCEQSETSCACRCFATHDSDWRVAEPVFAQQIHLARCP